MDNDLLETTTPPRTCHPWASLQDYEFDDPVSELIIDDAELAPFNVDLFV